MSRRVVLVDFFWSRDKDPRVPLGHASLLAALRATEGVEARSVVHAVNEGTKAPVAVAEAILTECGARRPDEVDVAIGAYVWGEALLQQVLPLLRGAGFRGRILLGGPQVSYAGAGLERIYPEADGFVRGYGETALAALATRPGRPRVRGVHWAGEEDRLEQAAVDLASLPSPWLTGLIPLRGRRFVRWETQRGCQFRCAFCQHREAGARMKRRALLRQRILAEIDLFCEAGVEEIAVLDPVFNAGPHAVEVLERFAERGFSGRLSLQCRAELVRDEFLDAAAALRTRLEFGLQTIHPDEARAVRRPNRMDLVDRALAAVRERGIEHEVSLIFGLPLQTLRSFEQSVAWCLERRVPVVKAFPLMLLRGTALERERERWGLEESGGPMPFVIASDTFDVGEWMEMARLSEVLRRTEGRHPQTLAELKEMAASMEPDLFRWVPRRLGMAA